MKNVLILCTGNACRSQMAEVLLNLEFVGIRPLDAPRFIVAQLLGAVAATAWFKWLIPTLPSRAEDVMLPHPDTQ